MSRIDPKPPFGISNSTLAERLQKNVDQRYRRSTIYR
jgi:hypothetical protein